MAENVVVIGGGPGGYVAAIRAADLGASVILVEKENLGGTCLNWGCIPSKIMKNSADLLLKTRKAAPLGIKVTGDIQFDMAALMERKNKIIQTQRGGIAGLLKKRGIQIEEGHGMIMSPGKVRVEKNDGSLVDLNYDRLIIATGTCPLNVPDFPFDHSQILSSNDILEIKSVPEEIMIIGGGVIGCEFAFIFWRSALR
jgi:dihydrolipoamide dehydrogenase